jgi:hypothetical protein
MVDALRVVVSMKYFLVLTGFIIGTVGALGHSAHRAASIEANADLAAVVSVEADVLRELGYGGLIHNFKNYVLRGSHNYRAAAINKVFRLRAALDALQEIVPDDYRDDINAVRVTVNNYRMNLDIAQEAIARGDGPRTIDALVKIDDAPATRALEALMREVRETLTRRQQDLQNDLKVFVRGLILLIMTVLALIGALILETGRLHKAQLRASDDAHAKDTRASDAHRREEMDKAREDHRVELAAARNKGGQ